MSYVKFGSYQYALAPSGYGAIDNQITFLLDNRNELISIDELIEILKDKDNTQMVEVVSNNGKSLVVYRDYPNLVSVATREDYVINTSTDPETGEIIEEKISVIRVALEEDNLTQNVSKNTSDIEYIAIMSDIELE